ncbi:hypothetical protein ACFQMA_10270 [Halosimplex aquaticum]|uniref:Uncharacterized protein n=1 Tax=Halosimplex aquaticum TaxID=3026162 RepID=A0ABD5Y4C5_9EURY|nr:hypothetical protein [Halosimplex aquaticum]
MSGSDGGTAFADATTVLLLASDVQNRSIDAGVRALRRVDEHVDRAAAVTIRQSASEWLSLWDRSPLSATMPVTCVDVDEDTRSAATEADGSSDPTVERVSDPTDLEALGRQISDVLERADDEDDDVGVVVHSLTGVLRYVDESTAFKFVYTLGEVTRRVDGVVFFHLDPEAHDPASVETFRILCDAVVQFDGPRSSVSDR